MQNWMRGRTIVYNPAPKVKIRPRRFHVGRILWSAFKRTCAVIGAFVLFLSVLGVVSAIQSGKKSAPVLPKEMILTLRLSGSLQEDSGMSQYMRLLKSGEENLTLGALVDSIENAARDDRVKALAFKASGAGYDLAQLQEIRRAVMDFKKSGKKTYIYSESFGDSGYGLGLYYLASSFDEIWMQPVGVVAVGGISAEMPFFRNVMEKYGVEAQFFQRKEYKNAMEHLTSSSMSPSSREETQGLIDNLAAQLVTPIKRDRKSVSKSFDQLMNLGLITDHAALAAGLIDKVDYEDGLLDHLDQTYADADLIGIETYAQADQRKDLEKNLLGGKKTTVAVVHIDGMIVSGSSGRSPYGFEEQMASADDIADTIRDVAADKRVKAIVLRVNSPGGSPTASETIASAVHYAKEKKNKPVYVSMGSVAASGGYWISAGADKIYAMDGTLTGSIGVVGGKINLEKLWKKFDVNWERVQVGQNSGMMSMNTPFSASEQRQFELSLDNVYDHFIRRVAEGRKMKPEDVEKIAKGHVWTGQQAKKNGLVDEIGGLNAVLEDIAKVNGLSSRRELTVLHLPSVNNPLDILFELLSSQASLRGRLGVIGDVFLTMAAADQSPRLVYDPSLPDVRR